MTVVTPMGKVVSEELLQVAEMLPWTMSVAVALANVTMAPLADVALAVIEIGQVMVGAVVSAAAEREEGVSGLSGARGFIVGNNSHCMPASTGTQPSVRMVA